MTTTSLPDATAIHEYSASVEAEGGTPPYKFAVLGAPPGIAISLLGG